MRGNLARFRYRPPFIFPSGIAAFSSSAGRGRGRGSDFSRIPFAKDESASVKPPPAGFGHGQGGNGRGKPIPSSPALPPSPSSVENVATPSAGRGSGQLPPLSSNPSRTPFFFVKDEETSAASSSASLTSSRGRGKTLLSEEKHSNVSSPDSQTHTIPVHVRHSQGDQLSATLVSALSGAGRGKPSKPPSVVPDKPKEENRHRRARRTQQNTVPRLSREEARKKAVGILSRGGDGVEEGVRAWRGGYRGRGSRGRGLQASRGRGERGSGGRGRTFEDADDEADFDLDEENDLADQLSAKLGPDIMNQLVEGFEEMSSRVLPSPVDDAYVDALHTNISIECEPEFLMEEFGTNPDIEEKPPIPLRDALEKMKPFLMAYEGIENQQKWEEVVEETMQKVPLLREIVDYYSGPDRVTAKQQGEELERVAKTLPKSVPTSVKCFTDRAVLSLQSNPGWGFDKKCQFMDKLMVEFSQNYK